MIHRHAMPFGASVLAGGGARFALWAPGARSVALQLDDPHGPRRLDVPLQPDGWATLDVTDTQPGARYRWQVDDDLLVPDPASRFNPDDVDGPSLLVDPAAFDWPDDGWRGRPWHEAVVYELHVGTFTPEGRFDSAAARLPWLRDLGITVVELMPVADFPGHRGWGYDGVLPFAPDASYGTPDDLKRFVAQAHALGISVMLDVVYNHFGPAGNWLGRYAPPFFDEGEHTPWGAAIGFAGERSATVRDFFVHNALYWLHEFRFDGLRLDAVHAIRDRSDEHLLLELARRVRESLEPGRHVHLVLENDANEARWLDPSERFDAQWNDDFHHAAHVLATGERDGYYADYATTPAHWLGRCLAEGFAWQGEPSPYRSGEPRGEPSLGHSPLAFVDFLQNHDQIGNRAFGERLTQLAPATRLRALSALLLLSPPVPMLFMGEEFAAATPFLYFCDHSGELARLVTEGRRREFAGFGRFADPAQVAAIPDPGAESTFVASKLDWSCLQRAPHAQWLEWYRRLLTVRRDAIVPLLPHLADDGHLHRVIGDTALEVRWQLSEGHWLRLLANLGDVDIDRAQLDAATHAALADAQRGERLFSVGMTEPPAHALPADSVLVWVGADD